MIPRRDPLLYCSQRGRQLVLSRTEGNTHAKKTLKDLIAQIKDAARAVGPGIDEGTSCTQTSFKVGKKAFLYVGEQGGRGKAMFKLGGSLDQAEQMADDTPDDVQVGKGGWVTARFSPDKPLPARTWKKWLKESYALASA